MKFLKDISLPTGALNTTAQTVGAAVTELNNKIGQGASLTKNSQNFTGDGVTTSFTLSTSYKVGFGRLDTYVGGIRQAIGANFTEGTPDGNGDSNVLNLTEAPANGVLIESVSYGGPLPSTTNHVQTHKRGSGDQLSATDIFGAIAVMNVKDYGAIGNGTTDDTTAFENAIASCPNGGAVFVPPSATPYKLTRMLNINKPIKFFGLHKAFETEDQAEKATLLQFSSTVTVGIKVSQYDALIEGIAVECLNVANTFEACIYLEGLTGGHNRNSQVRNVAIRAGNSFGSCLKTRNVLTCTLDNVKTSQGAYGFECMTDTVTGTSITFNRTWATNAVTSGYYVSNHVYCAFINTTHDSVNSPQHGYDLHSCKSISFVSSAAEYAQKALWNFDGCDGIGLYNCFGTEGNGSNTDLANMVSIVNSTKNVVLSGCVDNSSNSSRNVYADTSSDQPIVLGCEFPFGVQVGPTIYVKHWQAKGYIQLGGSFIYDDPASVGAGVYDGRAGGFGTKAKRIGVIKDDYTGWEGYFDSDGSLVVKALAQTSDLPAPTSLYRGRIFRTNGKVSAKEVMTLNVTSGATASANIWINLNGDSRPFAVTSGQTAATIAANLRASSFPGWVISGSGTSVVYTATDFGDRTGVNAYDPTTSGVSTTLTTTTEGATGEADGIYMCKMLASGAYDWVQIG